MAIRLPPPAPGQFDDAEDDALASAPAFNPREGATFIDEEQELLAWSDDSAEEEEEEEEGIDPGQGLEVDDEDWEIAERDFTKHYNRLKQHIAVTHRPAAAKTMQSQSKSMSGEKSEAPVMAHLPAINQRRTQSNPTDKKSAQLEALSKFNARIANIDTPYTLRAGVNPKGASLTANQKDKADRATTEQVLDPRTRVILLKMIGRGLVSQINGVVSTGKEANVYHAVSPPPEETELKLPPHLAMKIYKTSILSFRARSPYITGEYRFKTGYASSRNPRKMVRLWAEKEMRNLRRLKAAGIACPEPIEVRENVLVMEFLVTVRGGMASPRLRDFELRTTSEDDEMDLASQFYIQMMVIVRRMYHVCKLVHADLSEWNVLVHKPLSYDTPSSTSNNTINDSTPSAEPQLYVIDVSQSVEHDHPLAFDFLRKDLTNVDAFFKGKRVRTVGLRRGFEWVISEWTEGTSGEEKLKDLMMEDADDEVEDDGSTAAEASKSPTVKDESEYVFMNSYIPRTLNEVYDPERDIELLKKARTMKLDETSKNNPDAQAVSERLLYQQAGIIGIVDSKPSEAAASGSGGKEKSEKEKKGVRFANDSAEGEKEGEGEEGDDASSDEEGSDEDGEGGEGEYKPRMPRGHRHEDKDAKKERKNKAKEEAREKRKNKMPKGEKKRRIKNTARSG